MSEPTETQTQWPENGMRERIAELEAENERLTWDRNKYQKLYEVWASANAARADKNFQRAEQAEAELAARDEALTIAYRFALQTHWEGLRKHLEPFSLDLRARSQETDHD